MLKPATLTVSPALAEEDDLEAEELPEVGEELAVQGYRAALEHAAAI